MAKVPELKSLFDIFPCFQAIPHEEWAAANPQLKLFPPKSTLFRSDDAAAYTLFLISGTVQISHLTEDGRQALSNRLSAGDICAMMVLSGLSEREYPGTITAETEVTVLLVAKESFLRWIQVYAPVRTAVFGNILEGLLRMGSLLTDTMSQPLDSRLAGILLKLTSESHPTLRITHQQLAVELSSAREVVSRVLGQMKRKSWIVTGRGSITIMERKALTELLCD
jgi:CRP/FNR family transcriptional regulator